MSDERVEVEIAGKSGSAIDAIAAATNALRSGVSDMKGQLESLTSAFSVVTDAIAAIGAVLLGGKLFEEAISATKEFTAETLNLGRSMGVSASEASTYAVAIEQVGGQSSDFAAATQGLTRQIRTHESAINDMGIKTRDAGGHLREMNDILFDAIDTVNAYTDGTDRNLAAQTAFGRGVSGASAVLKLTRADLQEAKKSAEELGLVVGAQNVKDFQENRKAMAEANDVMLGLKKAVGDELLPILTQFAEWFREIGPAAIQVTRTAMADLAAIFWTVTTAVTAVWDVIKAMVISVIGPLTSLGKAIYDAMTGNWKQAKEDLAQIGPALKATWASTFDDIAESARKSALKIQQAFTDPTGDAAGGKKGKHFDTEADKKALEDLANYAQELDTRVTNEHAQVLEQLTRLNLKEANERERQMQELSDYAIELETRVSKEHSRVLQQMSALNQRITKEWLAQWQQLARGIESSLTSSLAGLLEGTKSWTDAMRSLFNSLIEGVIGIFAKMAVQWAENMIMQKVLGKTTAASQIAANSGMAATAAMASVAAIPFVGWAMAPGVGAATLAEGMAYESVLSAAGGFDVPSGINPMTQLHEREMVLPAQLADAVRGMSSGGGQGGGGAVEVSFPGVDLGNHYLMDKRMLATAIKTLVREGHLKASMS